MFLSLKLSTTLPSSNASGKPTFTFDGGSESTLGNRKRTVTSVSTPVEAVRMAQARPIQEKKERNPRRSAPFFGGAFAAGAAGLGAVDVTGGVAAAGAAGGAGGYLYWGGT